MHDLSDWSLGLGRWRGVPLRVHALFFMLALFVVLLGDRSEQGLVLIGLAILFFSVLLHEAGHILAAIRLGGHVDEVVLGPFGGLAPVTVPERLRQDWIAAAAGPVVNLLVVLILLAPLTLLTDARPGDLLNPLAPSGEAAEAFWMSGLKLAVWINWMLFLTNLLPAFPFDGGLILRSLLRPLVGLRSATVYTSRVAIAVACCLVVAAWFVRDAHQVASLSASIPIAALAVFLVFSARRDQERLADGDHREPLRLPAEPEDSILEDIIFEEIDEENAVLVEKWQSRARHEEAYQEVDANEDERLDDVLARLYESSLDALSPEDRQLLWQASIRYRRRIKQRKMDG